MQEKLLKFQKTKAKRLGRGYGSGKGGHTSGRGQKGQKARSSINILFEGVKVKKSFIKRLPLKRGKSKFKGGKKVLVVKLADLNRLTAGSKVDLTSLIKNKIVDQEEARKYGVKILSLGKLSKRLNLELPISKSAAKQVEKLGGKILSVKKG
jgi:large subunit ribosomal protein L15